MATKLIPEIVKDIKAGKFSRDFDETDANGFWDLAGEIAFSVYYPLDPDGVSGEMLAGQDELQQELYNTFWEIVEATL